MIKKLILTVSMLILAVISAIAVISFAKGGKSVDLVSIVKPNPVKLAIWTDGKSNLIPDNSIQSVVVNYTASEINNSHLDIFAEVSTIEGMTIIDDLPIHPELSEGSISIPLKGESLSTLGRVYTVLVTAKNQVGDSITRDLKFKVICSHQSQCK